jgi:hypothetical protein
MRWLVFWVCLLPAAAFSDEPGESSVASQRRRVDEKRRASDLEPVQTDWERSDAEFQRKKRVLFAVELLLWVAYVALCAVCARREKHTALGALAFFGAVATAATLGYYIAMPPWGNAPGAPAFAEIAGWACLVLGILVGLASLALRGRVVACSVACAGFATVQLLVAWQVYDRVELWP